MFMWCLFDVGLHPNNEVISEDDGEKKVDGDVSAEQKAANTDEENANRRLFAQKMRNHFDLVIDQASDSHRGTAIRQYPVPFRLQPLRRSHACSKHQKRPNGQGRLQETLQACDDRSIRRINCR